MYGYIYKTTFLETGLYYVGQHKATKFEPHKYLGSGTIFLRILNKQKRLAKQRGEKWKEVWHKYFKCELLQECITLTELIDAEIFWVDKLKARDRAFGYNINPGGWSGGMPNPSEETRQKLRDANKNKICVYNDCECIKVHKNDLQVYLDKGYIKGVPPFERSEEFKQKVSSTLTGYKCIHKGAEKSRVPADEVDYYLSIGYELGWSKSEKLAKPTGPRKGMLSPTGQYKVIAESERDTYIKQGWVFGAPKIPVEKRNFGVRPSDETRKKLSESHKGKTKSKEAVEKQAAKIRGRITVNKNGAKKLIYKKDLESYLATGWTVGGLAGEKHPRSKAVVCYETGEEFESITAAQKVYNKSSFLKRCLKLSYDTMCAGKHWYYKEDLDRKKYLEENFPKG